MRNYRILICAVLATVVSMAAAFAEERIPRISYVSGDVALRSDGDDAWESADANMPIRDGDLLSAEKNGLAEIQVDDGSFIRVNRSSEIQFDQLKEDRILLKMRFGDVIVHVRSSAEYIVQTPQGTVRLQREGVYRVTAENQNTLEIQTKAGKAHFENEMITRKISEGRRLVVNNGDEEIIGYLRRDDEFDEWSEERDSRYASVSQSSRYLPSSVSYGVYDLDSYGSWVSVADYGWCWRPYNVWDDWAPYRYGYWRWCGGWGYTWVSYDPWGWLPYHYGRWTYCSSYGWVWLPGSSWGVDFWCPGAVRFGMWGGHIGWCALGPGDYYWDYWRSGSHHGGYHNGGDHWNDFRPHHNGVTYVSTDDFRSGRPIGAGTYNRNLLIGNSSRGSRAIDYRHDSATAQQIFQRDRIVDGAPKIDPLRSASAGHVNSGRNVNVTSRDVTGSATYSRSGSTIHIDGRGNASTNQSSVTSARTDDFSRSGASRPSSGVIDIRGSRTDDTTDSGRTGSTGNTTSGRGTSSGASVGTTGSTRSDYSRGSASTSQGSTGSSRGATSSSTRSDYSRDSSDSTRSGGYTSSGSSRSDYSRGSASTSQGSSGSSRGTSSGSSRSDYSRSSSSDSSRSSGSSSSNSSSSSSSSGSSISSGSSSRSDTGSSTSTPPPRPGRSYYDSSSDNRGRSGIRYNSNGSTGYTSRSYSSRGGPHESRSYSGGSSRSDSGGPSYSGGSSRSYSGRSGYSYGGSSRSYSGGPSYSGGSSRSYSGGPSYSGGSSRSYSGGSGYSYGGSSRSHSGGGSHGGGSFSGGGSHGGGSSHSSGGSGPSSGSSSSGRHR